MSYSATNHYLPSNHSEYYQPSHAPQSNSHGVPRSELAQRKRPKYTRSKTGCLTCRVKKIKCDETKPVCMRCSHGQRDCTWPEGAPTRKKPMARRDSIDGRPSTAGSSGLSDTSNPPTREHSPPRRLDVGLLPLPSRRSSDSYIHLHPMKTEPDSGRLPSLHTERSSVYTYPPPSHHILPALPEPCSYSSRYDHAYTNTTPPSRQTMSVPYRSTGHQPVNHFNSPPDSMNSYYHPLQERTLLSHSSPNESHNRY